MPAESYLYKTALLFANIFWNQPQIISALAKTSWESLHSPAQQACRAQFKEHVPGGVLAGPKNVLRFRKWSTSSLWETETRFTLFYTDKSARKQFLPFLKFAMQSLQLSTSAAHVWERCLILPKEKHTHTLQGLQQKDRSVRVLLMSVSVCY